MPPKPRDVLQGAIPFSELVSSLAQYAPVPGLQAGAKVVTTLLQLLEGRYENDEAFQQLLKEACEFIAALNSWTTKPEDELGKVDAALLTTCKALEQIAKKAKKQSERNAFSRVLFSKDDTKAIVEWQRQLKQAIDVFETNSHLSLHEEIRLLKSAALATLMRDYIVPTASYDTSDKDNSIRCLDKTREAILRGLMTWLKDIEDPKQFVWLSAPAGGGKTAICRTFCKLVREAKIALASYFLFKSSGRSSISKLLATLAYGIAEFNARARSTLQHIVTTNAHVFNKSLKTQFNEVMIPILKASLNENTNPRPPLLILVDGLDECDDKPERTELLTLFHDALPQLDSAIKVIFSSRAESDIETAVTSLDQTNIYKEVIEPDDKDIRTILAARFQKIQSSHPGRQHIPPEWPGMSQYEMLVEDSSGYPIFATVAMDYVECGSGGPVAALRDVLRWTSLSDTSDWNPLVRLRALYRSILNTSRNPCILGQILELVILYQPKDAGPLWPQGPTNQLAAEVLPGVVTSSASTGDEWDGLDIAQIDDALRDVPSLVSYQFLEPPLRSDRAIWEKSGDSYIRSISFFHKSFPDFLLSEPPSPTFKLSVNLDKCAENVLIRCITLLGNREFLTHRFYRSFNVSRTEHYQYAERWDYHYVVRVAIQHLSHSTHAMSPRVRKALLSYDFSDIDVSFGFVLHFLPYRGDGPLVQYRALINACKEFPDLTAHFQRIGDRCLAEIPGFKTALRTVMLMRDGETEHSESEESD